MTNHEKIIELNKIWYSLIGGTHHKDRDCHFRINTHYYYGGCCEYEVEHHGYILHDKEAQFCTLYEAQDYLIKDILRKGILGEIDSYLEHYGDLEWDQHPHHNDHMLREIKEQVLAIAPE
jgi:hypothetical protein